MSLAEVKRLIDFGDFKGALDGITKLEGKEKLYGLIEKIGILLYVGKIDESIQLSFDVATEAKKTNDIVLELAAKSFRSFDYIWKNDFQNSLQLIEESENIFPTLNSTQKEASIRFFGVFEFTKGIYLQRTGLFKQSLATYYHVLDKWEKSKWVFGINVVWGYISTLLLNQGELSLAEEFLNKRLEFAISVDNKSFLARVHMQLGDFYKLKFNYTKAIDSYEQSIQLYEKLKETRRIPEAIYNLILLFVERKDTNSANVYLEKLNVISTSNSNSIVKSRFKIAKAMILKSSKELTQRKEAFDILNEIVGGEVFDAELSIFSILNLCDLILDLGSMEEQTWVSQILEFSKKLQDIGKSEKNKLISIESLVLQSRLAITTSNFEKAFELLSQAEEFARIENFDELLFKISTYKQELELTLKNLYADKKEKINISQVALPDIVAYLEEVLKIYRMASSSPN